MKTSISRDNIIENKAEGSQFKIFKDKDAPVDERFIIRASGYGSNSVVRLSENELKVVYQFCKKTFDYT
jgi:spore coat polysaccharide biosynthesis protein SpsF (cytidylyltransferase family)